jgi:arabinofuranosyltransferase
MARVSVNRSIAARAALWVFALCGAGILVKSAWMSDDAYITLRTIDNFWHGYGLRWNAMERVQAYTDPLWMMLVGAAYGVTREAYFTTLALSAVCTAATIALVVTRIATSAGGKLVALALLFGSKSFVEFSTSGLENPLTHLLLALCVWQYWSSPPPEARVWRVSWLAGLCALNRLDSLALTGPLLLASVWTARARSWRTLGAALAGFLPLVAWELFSVIYYGFLLPNTVYAKLATGVPKSELIAQGVYYLRDSLISDPVTLPTIAAAIASALWSRGRRTDADTNDGGVNDARANDARVIAIGLIASVLFVINVGGDFMTGRFLSAPFVVAVIVICRALPARAQAPGWVPVALAAGITLCSAASPQSPWTRPFFADPLYSRGRGIIDERSFYYPFTGLVPVLKGARVQDFGLSQHGARWRQRGVPHAQVFGAVGLIGFHAGPGVHIIDPNALADPLLARLPAKPGWQIGHFVRDLPKGYMETVERCLAVIYPNAAVVVPTTTCVTSSSRVNAIEDPRVAALYDRVALITQAPLFDRRRLWAIVQMHLPI